MKTHVFPLLFLALLVSSCRESKPRINYVRINPGDDPEEIIRKASRLAPSERQLAWQDLEFTAFVHFGMNTFTDREWGQGSEDPKWFNPTAFDAGQWARVAQDAGMKMIIVTAKHHDGFCLWPSAYTDHSVKSSPWRNGEGDVVGEVADACHASGLRFGVYLSPWDRHEPSYGTEQYNDHFVNQLTELLTHYGKVDEVWFDGACGEGPNGKRQVYDWLRYYTLIRKLQPGAVIAVMGPDVRWVGTESGYGRPTEWSVVPYAQANPDETAEKSQQEPVNGVFIPAGDMMEQDLGSRSKLIQANSLIWYPSEVDVSIRPGWFYHAAQDQRVKTPEKLLDIWFASVGQNSLLLLNVPPDKRGLIHENDAATLKGFREVRDAIFLENLAGGSIVKASSTALGTKAEHVLLPGRDRFWMANRGETMGWIEFELPEERTLDCLQVRENIEFGQRIEQFSIETWQDDRWREITRATTVGACRLVRFLPVTSSKIRFRILQSRNSPSLSYIGLHKRLPELSIKPGSGAFLDSVQISMTSDLPSHTIHYTLDGSEPDPDSPVYTQPFILDQSARIRAIAIDGRGVKSFEREVNLLKSAFSIRYIQPPSPKYPGKNQIVLVDGRLSEPDYSNGEWLGWQGNDMVAEIDLGESKEFSRIGADFLNGTDSWIFLPRAVAFDYSADGHFWQSAGRSVNEVPWDQYKEAHKEFAIEKSFRARYIRVTALGQKVCPPGHGGAGNPCWLFVDEIELSAF